jgi:hypothetical protein
MKITMYKLLGMIKDGKAPKIIKYANYIWTYEKCVSDYTNDSEYLFADVMSNVDDNAIFLNDEVEILEEEKKIPEKIPEEIIVGKKQPTHRIKKIENKINEIINYLDYLKSKGE